MVVRELTAGDLGDEVLVDLIRHDDPLGVLSIYVDGVSAVTGRGAAIGIKNRLVELERNVADHGSPAVRMRSARRSGGSGPRSSDSSTHARTVAVTRCSLGSAAPSW